MLSLAAALLAGNMQRARAESIAGVCALGVFPYLPALSIEKLYGPVAAEIAEVLGTDIQLKTKETFEDFTEEVAAGSYDVLVAHPFLYVLRVALANAAGRWRARRCRSGSGSRSRSSASRL